MGTKGNFFLGQYQMLNLADAPIAPTILAFASSESNWISNFSSSAIGILQVAIGLGFVIFVHELGHFLAAKFFGVKCEKFYIGFDVPIKIGPIRLPSSLGKFRWGETEYGIGIIPLGGYVKMLGQDDDPRRAEEEAARIKQKDDSNTGIYRLDPRSFPAKPVYARMVIISAGVVMNLIFAVLMAAYAFRGGVPYQPTIVGEVVPGDPAWQSGLLPGDQVLQVASMKEPDEKLQYSDMTELIAISGLSDASKKIPLKLRRDGKEVSYEIAGTKRHDPRGIQTMLGIKFARTTQFIKDPQVFKKLMLASHGQDLGIQPGDRIIGADGKSLPQDQRAGVPLDYSLEPILAAKFDFRSKLNFSEFLKRKALPKRR